MAGKPKEALKILVADSHETSLHVVAIMLHKLGYPTVLEAPLKPDAVKMLAEHTKNNSGMTGLLGSAAPKEICTLDLLIIDSDLEPGGGVAWLKELRAKFKASDLPVLFTAMKGREEFLSAATVAGANDTLVKPFTRDALGLKLDILLGGSRAPVIKSFTLGAPAKPAEKSNGAKSAATPAPEAVVQSLVVRNTGKPTSAAKGGGPSFHGRGAQVVSYDVSGPASAELVDGKVDGHYHEKVNVIGGGQNCYWARQIPNREEVKLEYLSNKGLPTGMEAKKITLEQFMYTFVLCDEDNCPILARLANEKA